jgi:alanine racemase
MPTMFPFPFRDERFSNCSRRLSHSAGMSRSLLLGLIATFLLVVVWSWCTTSPNTSATVTPPRVITSENSHAWLEISLPAFEHNIAQVKSLVGPRTQICAVLKADAYGHGIALLMPSVIAAGVPYVGITSNEEAATVRSSGYAGKVMRLRMAPKSEIEAALPYSVEELLGNYELAKEASAIATAHHTQIRFQFALNSAGMSRNDLGVKTDAGKADALNLLKLPGLTCVGIMTHFPTEDAEDVRAGLAAFNRESAWLISAGSLDRSKLLLHTANSFATLAIPESRLDLVRPGSILYGDSFSSHTEYQRVMAFKSRVASVNSYPAGNTVSYDRTYTLKRDSRLANIPVGYSDGYRRVFSNKGQVLIRGHRCPVVGRVTMNTIMVDATDFPDVQMSDEVVLFGKQGADEITQAELEDIAGTLLVDMSTLWGQANPKFLTTGSPAK